MTPHADRSPSKREHMPLLIIDLFREGFSTEEIVRLRHLRAHYPLTEHLSPAERNRLAALKWQVRRGVRGAG